MKFYQSIKFRLVAVTLLFGMVLVLFTGSVIFFMAAEFGDGLITNLIETEIDYFLYQYENDRTTLLPHSKYISTYKGIERAPEQFQAFLKGMEPGVHELEITEDMAPFHVGVIELPDTEEMYYLIYNTEAFVEDGVTLSPEKIFLISLGLLLIPGLIIGTLVLKAMFRPVNDLIVKIRDLNPENIPGQWEGSGKSNEIGILAQTIESAMNRIRKFIEREKQFTRDASHELRTPLTVVKGAVEIMQDQPEITDNPMLEKPLNRIRQSIKDMENLIETFLWLAREEDEPGRPAQVGATVQKAVESHQYLIDNKDVNVEIDIRHDTLLPVNEEIFYIAVANLVRNAFQFTSSGSISVIAEKDCITVTDTGIGIDPDKLDLVTRSLIKGEGSQGFGLGLSIVSRLCARFGWNLDIDSSPGEGTQIQIKWALTNS